MLSSFSLENISITGWPSGFRKAAHWLMFETVDAAVLDESLGQPWKYVKLCYLRTWVGGFAARP